MVSYIHKGISLHYYVVEREIVYLNVVCMLRHLVQGFVCCPCAEILSLLATWYS